MIKKAELHVHIDGAISPRFMAEIAKRNQIHIPPSVFGPQNTFVWRDFLDFLSVYDVVAGAIQTPEDYRDIVFHYLCECAKKNVIYVEFFLSSAHAHRVGMSYEIQLEGVVQGIKDAHAKTGIEARVILTAVRHFGIEACELCAQLAHQYPHDLVVGFGIAGDEIHFPAKDYQKAFQIAFDAGLHCTAHAGEMAGPESVWEALTYLPVKRIGHGVRSIEDQKLIDKLIDEKITLECCPTSNVALGVYKNYQSHPLRQLFDKGVLVTLNSDDPPYFATSIDREYEVAAQHFNFTENELIQLTRNAIVSSFCDEATKEKLFQSLKAK